MSASENIKVLYVAAEVWPFSKVGGLGDVAGALPGSLAAAGCDVRVVSPFYQCVEENFESSVAFGGVDIFLRLTHHRGHVRETTRDGLVHYFIECPHFFRREHIYNYVDDGERFVFFCRAVALMLKKLDWRPDVIHCNDWQTGILPAMLKTALSGDSFFEGVKSVFSIHNLAYQGAFPPHYTDVAGLPDEVFHFTRAEAYGSLNFLKAGVSYSDAVCAVSPTYAKEILTPEFGETMDPHLVEHKVKLHGILNGLDYSRFDPETDPALVQNFSAKKPAGKNKNKEALMKDLGLDFKKNKRIPLVGMVARISDQKGFSLVLEAMEDLMAMDLRLVILGSGDRDTEAKITAAAAKYPGRLAARFGYDPALASMIYAASDIFLMPSKYEPCGLGQMIAMRYGAIPVGRATGGIADTVKNYSPKTGKGTGVLFKNYSAAAMTKALGKALELYADKTAWASIVKNAMSEEFSWDKSAAQYVKMYRSIL